MRRISMVLLAALLAVSTVGVAGCTKRKSKKKGRSASSADYDRTNRTTPGPTRSSPSPSVNDPVGKACSEILEQVNTATGMAWKFDDKQKQATPDTMREGGARKCHFEVASTATLPAAIMGLTLYRIERRFDDGPDDVRSHAEKQADCTEKLASPPSGTTLAVQCLERHGGTLFDVQTTLSGQRGYALVFLAMQPKTASTAVETKARGIGSQVAAIALASV